MNTRLSLGLAIVTALYAGAALPADKDTLALRKALSQQVSELKQHATQSDARILELEDKLRQERVRNQQGGSVGNLATAKPSAVIAPTSAALPSAGKTATAAVDPLKEPKPAVTLGDTKGTFKIPGTNTSLGFGGYVKMDVVESSVGSGGSGSTGDTILLGTQIPVGVARKGEEDILAFTAQSSRLWFKSFTPSQWGDINTYLELDFYGGGSGTNYTPRIRHAYGSWGIYWRGKPGRLF